MRVGVNESTMSACSVVSTLGNVAACENGHRSEEMIRILLRNDALDLRLALRIAVSPVEAHADPAHAAFQQRAYGVHNVCVRAVFTNADDILLGKNPIQHHASGIASIQLLFVTMGNEQTDAGAGALGQYIGGNRRGPADQLQMFQKRIEVSETKLRTSLRQAVEQTHRQIMRRRVDLHAHGFPVVGEKTVRQGPSDVDVSGQHNFLLKEPVEWSASRN